MNKRTDAIRSMFKMPEAGMLSTDNAPMTLPRVSAGSVRSLKDTFSDVEHENERLRAHMSAGQVAIPLDPALIDPSPLADRFVEQDEAAFEELKRSIAEKGQIIAIQVRPHPKVAGRYQSAFGHRRVRAARDLGIEVKAYVHEMSDEDLVVAQGVENSAREDLSFIERAVFASRLEEAGFQRSVVQSALSIDRAEASKLVAVAKAVPHDIVEAIGRAPKIGRARWQAMADALREGRSAGEVRKLAKSEGFLKQPTDARFLTAFTTAAASGTITRDAATVVRSKGGEEIARLDNTDRRVRITVDKVANDAFAAHLIDRLPDLYEAFVSDGERQDGNGRKPSGTI